jgi:superoxide dismutase, Cu-Zn family
MRRIAACLLAVLALAAGCTGASGGTRATPSTATRTAATPSHTGSAAPTVVPTITVSGTFAAYAPGATAITYDPKLVPPGATATVTIAQGPANAEVRLAVSGLLPSRSYGAHLHVNPCGPSGADAGPHYQHQHDPAASPSKPSVNPSYANPRNEVWLDFTTGRDGKASVTAVQPWTFTVIPRSLVIHAVHTRTMPGESGDAGTRVACLTLHA